LEHLKEVVSCIFRGLAKESEGSYKPKKEAISFSSIHRAKGIEVERVFIIAPKLFFSPPKGKEDIYDDKDSWHLKEEWNLIYVALTRSKDVMTVLGRFRYRVQQVLMPSPEDLSAGLQRLNLNPNPC
jgi:superfamily I DNA/RNA helicase